MFAPALLAAALGLSACDAGATLGEPGDKPRTLTVSGTYRQSDPDGAAQRVTELTEAISDLRDATSSGWVGRQDDLTGYLSELSGGRYRPEAGGAESAVINRFMDEYGGALFGVGGAELTLGRPSTPTVAHVVSVRTSQVLSGVPVVDGELVFSLEVNDVDTRLNAVRGRVFPGLSPATEPTVGARAAARTARAASGGAPRGRPQLAILPTGEGVLAWAVRIGAAPADTGSVNLSATYYVDAQNGAVIDVRAESAEGLTALPSSYRVPGSTSGSTRGLAPVRVSAALAEGDPVPVTGTSRVLGEVKATGVEHNGAIVLKDTTTPTYDAGTGQGGIETYDISGRTESDLPGTLASSPSGTFRDGVAVAAQSLSRAIYDYYAALGRRSWDDQGSAMVSSVNFGDSDFCNAYFDDSLPRAQMVYGVPCGLEEFVEPDVAAHEITHGVTASSANLIYSGQPGALNEGFSDYFGNVIGNLITGHDDGRVGEVGLQPAVGARGPVQSRPPTAHWSSAT